MNAVCTRCRAHIEDATADEATEFMRAHADCPATATTEQREAARCN